MKVMCMLILAFQLASVTRATSNIQRQANVAISPKPQPPPMVEAGPKQERRNRLVPDFKPFNHPASKAGEDDSLEGVLGPDSGRSSGPISRVEWLELVPVFGHLYSRPASINTRANQSSSMLILLGAGGGSVALLGFFFKSKSETAQNTKSEELMKKREAQESRKQQLSSVPDCRLTRSTVPDPLQSVSSSVSNKSAPQTRVPEVKTAVEVPHIAPESTGDWPTTSPRPPKKQEQKVIKEKNTARKLTKDNVGKMLYADQVNPPEFESKIKSFKLTKTPKTHSCTITEHGLLSEVLSTLEVLQLQKTEKLSVAVQTALADLSIEGANLSRLRITDVRDDGKDELLAKTMTIKEYMVYIANSKIEEAVKKVRDECSLENIRNLAETIKKYRPESTKPTSEH